MTILARNLSPDNIGPAYLSLFYGLDSINIRVFSLQKTDTDLIHVTAYGSPNSWAQRKENVLGTALVQT